jgi:hypothetical protein
MISVLSGLLALVSLLVTIVLLPVPGGVLFAPFTFGLFLLALAGVVDGASDHRVRQRDPRTDPTRWRRSH